MKKAELLKLGSSKPFGLALDPSMNRAAVLAAVLEKHATLTIPVSAPKPAGNRAKFLALTTGGDPGEPAGDDAEEITIETPVDGRGGAREGAGRKPGLTNDQCKIRNLPTTANESVREGVRLLGALLVLLFKSDDLAFTDSEIDRAALPLTRLLEYHGLSIPQSASVHLEAAGVVGELGGSRLFMIRELRKQKRNGTASQKSHNPGQDGIGQNGIDAQSVPAI